MAVESTPGVVKVNCERSTEAAGFWQLPVSVHDYTGAPLLICAGGRRIQGQRQLVCHMNKEPPKDRPACCAKATVTRKCGSSLSSQLIQAREGAQAITEGQS